MAALSRVQFSAETTSDNVHTWHRAQDEDGNEIGRALVTHKPGNTYLNSVKVDREHRRNGVGRQLLQRVIDTHGAQDITLTPEPFDAGGPGERRLRSFYGSMGFTRNGKSQMVRRAG